MEESCSTFFSTNPLILTAGSSSTLEPSKSTSSFDSACRLEEEISETSIYSVSSSDECKSDVILLKLDTHCDTSSTTNSPEFVSDWLAMFKKIPKFIQQNALEELVNLCSHSHVKFLQSVIAPRFQKDFIMDLPIEISLKIFENLFPTDLVKVAQISPFWRRLAEDGFLWKRKCREHGIRDIYTDLTSQALSEISEFSRESEISKSLEVCLKRSKWKALYLRNRRIQRNWRKGQPIAKCILKGHDEHVITCLQVRGDLIITGSDDHTIRMWSAASGELLNIFHGHTGGVWSLLLSEDGKLVISGSTDRTVRIWSVENKNLKATLLGHSSTVRCMALKDNKLVSGSRDNTLKIWDISTNQLCRTLSGHRAAVRCVQFDGKRIISGGYDYHIVVWNADNGKIIYVLTGHTSRFESERDLVISGSLDTTIKIWNIIEGVCLHTLIGHQSLTSGMQLNGNILVSANADSTIKVWNITDSVCLHTLAGPYKHQSAVTSVQFVGDSIVATSSDDGTVKLWDIEQGVYICDLHRLNSHRTGGCVWRIKATPTLLVCAAGSRNGTEDTQIIILDFNAPYP